MIPTLLLFGIKNKYKKRDITSQILYHVIDQKKHERIGFMSHNNCILTLLDLKDKNITFSENWMEDVQINGIRSKVISGISLFNRPIVTTVVISLTHKSLNTASKPLVLR